MQREISFCNIKVVFIPKYPHKKALNAIKHYIRILKIQNKEPDSK